MVQPWRVCHFNVTILLTLFLGALSPSHLHDHLLVEPLAHIETIKNINSSTSTSDLTPDVSTFPLTMESAQCTSSPPSPRLTTSSATSPFLSSPSSPMSDVPILVTTSDPYNMADAADAEKRPVGDVDETVNDVTIGPSVNSSSPIRDTPIFVTCSHSETTLGDVSNVPEKQSVGDVDLTADDTAMCEPSSTTPTISAFLKSSRIPDTPILVGSIPQTTLGDVLDDTVERRMGDVEQAADDVAIGEPSSTVAAIGPSLQLSCSPKQRSANDFLRSSMSPQYPTIDPSVLRTHSPVAARRLSISVEKELSTSTVSESSNGAMDVSDDNPSAGLGQETARECAGTSLPTSIDPFLLFSPTPVMLFSPERGEDVTRTSGRVSVPDNERLVPSDENAMETDGGNLGEANDANQPPPAFLPTTINPSLLISPKTVAPLSSYDRGVDVTGTSGGESEDDDDCPSLSNKNAMNTDDGHHGKPNDGDADESGDEFLEASPAGNAEESGSATDGDGDIEMSESVQDDHETNVVPEEVSQPDTRTPRRVTRPGPKKPHPPTSINRPHKRRRKSASSARDVEDESDHDASTNLLDVDLYISRWEPLVDTEFVRLFSDGFS